MLVKGVNVTALAALPGTNDGFCVGTSDGITMVISDVRELKHHSDQYVSNPPQLCGPDCEPVCEIIARPSADNRKRLWTGSRDGIIREYLI